MNNSSNDGGVDGDDYDYFKADLGFFVVVRFFFLAEDSYVLFFLLNELFRITEFT